MPRRGQAGWPCREDGDEMLKSVGSGSKQTLILYLALPLSRLVTLGKSLSF